MKFSMFEHPRRGSIFIDTNWAIFLTLQNRGETKCFDMDMSPGRLQTNFL